MAGLNIDQYFIAVAGLGDHYAVGKVERGKELLEELKLEPDSVLLIGDTIHDYEVSRELDCKCLLVANGHQDIDRLQKCGVDIIDDLIWQETSIVSFLVCFVRKEEMDKHIV